MRYDAKQLLHVDAILRQRFIRVQWNKVKRNQQNKQHTHSDQIVIKLPYSLYLFEQNVLLYQPDDD